MQAVNASYKPGHLTENGILPKRITGDVIQDVRGVLKLTLRLFKTAIYTID